MSEDVMDRLQATTALCEKLEAAGPTWVRKPEVNFETSEEYGTGELKAVLHGRRAFTGELLLLVHLDATIRATRRTASALQQVGLLDTAAKCDWDFLNSADVELALELMYISADACSDKSGSYFATLPKYLNHLPLMWDDDQVEALNGSVVGSMIRKMRAEVREAFDAVVLQAVSVLGPVIGHACEQSLRCAFTKAMALVKSRSHHVPMILKIKSWTSHAESIMVPIIDLLNGSVDGSNNVVASISCMDGQDVVCVSACRELEDGEELILSYGTMATPHFLMTYGCVPSGGRATKEDRAWIWPNPAILPSCDEGNSLDRLRWQILQHLGYTTGKLRPETLAYDTAPFELNAADLNACAQGVYTVPLKAALRFFRALRADEKELSSSMIAGWSPRRSEAELGTQNADISSGHERTTTVFRLIEEMCAYTLSMYPAEIKSSLPTAALVAWRLEVDLLQRLLRISEDGMATTRACSRD